MKSEKGQSLIEIIFAVGVVSLVMVGVVSLMVSTIGTKNSSLSRKKAAEMSEVVIEKLLESKKNNKDDFWKLTPIQSGTIAGFEGLTYSVNFDKVTGNNCQDTPPNCAKAIIKINWEGGDDGGFVTSRFFSEIN